MGLNSTVLSPFPRPCLSQPAIVGSSSSKQVYDPKPVFGGFVVDKVTLGQIFLPVFLFLPVRITPPMLRISQPLTPYNVD